MERRLRKIFHRPKRSSKEFQEPAKLQLIGHSTPLPTEYSSVATASPSQPKGDQLSQDGE